MSQKLKISWIVLVLGCYFNVGCGPIYRTNYSFTPPKTPEGKVCASQCDSTQLHCKQMEDMIYETCQFRAKLARYYNNICHYNKNKKHKEVCYRPIYYEPFLYKCKL
jgi:hypothetical protein